VDVKCKDFISCLEKLFRFCRWLVLGLRVEYIIGFIYANRLARNNNYSELKHSTVSIQRESFSVVCRDH